jgi:hypothetical protein
MKVLTRFDSLRIKINFSKRCKISIPNEQISTFTEGLISRLVTEDKFVRKIFIFSEFSRITNRGSNSVVSMHENLAPRLELRNSVPDS